MDIFDVLSAVSKRKRQLMYSGVRETEALKKAELATSKEYHISLRDIKRLVGEKLDSYRSPPYRGS
jgi:hypothetical protein